MSTSRCAPPRYTRRYDWDDFQDIMTTSEVCAMLRVSDKTAHALLDEGKVRGCRVGKQYRFVRDSVRRYAYGEPDDTAAAPRQLSPCG